MNKHATTAALVAAFLIPGTLFAGMTITPSPGYAVVWDGNDGDGFTAANPAPVPANLATGVGAVAFTSSDLGVQLGIPYHVAANINDGFYSNGNSWIGRSDIAGVAFAGVKLGGFFEISSIAFGRDNGNGAFDDSDPGGDCCGGQADDRSLGVYTLQITRVGSPSAATPETASAASGWQTIATLNYQSSDDTILGGSFTSYFRHEFEVAAGGGAILVSGVRLLTPFQAAVDEIEIYGVPGTNPDPDGDGFDTALEISLGFDPNLSTSSPEGLSKTEPAVAVSAYCSDNNRYQIEASVDLQSWLPVEQNVQGIGDEIKRCYSIRGIPRRHFRFRINP